MKLSLATALAFGLSADAHAIMQVSKAPQDGDVHLAPIQLLTHFCVSLENQGQRARPRLAQRSPSPQHQQPHAGRFVVLAGLWRPGLHVEHGNPRQGRRLDRRVVSAHHRRPSGRQRPGKNDLVCPCTSSKEERELANIGVNRTTQSHPATRAQ